MMPANPKEGEVRLPPMVIDGDVAELVEEVRHQGRFPNRAEALRAIIPAGCRALLAEYAAKKAPSK